MKRYQNGFTLIELMIVVAIIGILAAIAIPSYQDYIVKAKLSKVSSAVDPLKLAIAAYVQEQGSYVGTAGAANTDGAGWTSLGLAHAATTINEAPLIAFTAGSDNANPNVINVTLGAIRAGTIDGKVVSMTPSLGSTAMTWTNTCQAGMDPVARKYFACTN